MSCRVIQTKKAPSAIGPYSQGIRAGSLLFVSGQLGMDPETGEFAGPELADQAPRAIGNMIEIVKAAGGSEKSILSVDVFLTDMKRFAEFNEIYSRRFSEHRPARAVVEVSALPKGGCIEIRCTAFLETP